MEIYNIYKKNIGKITSGGFSPTLNISIAIAYIDKFVCKKKDKLYCLIRNNFEEIELTKLPFVNHNYRRLIIWVKKNILKIMNGLIKKVK